MDRVLGIINFGSNVKVEGLEDYRPISAASILGRYRVIDFMLSNFTNSRIQRTKVFIKNRPRSLVEHINSTNYNINSKKGKIHLLYGEKEYINSIYNTDVSAFRDNMQYILDEKCDYVVMAPSHFVYTQDFSKMVDYAKENNDDVVILYQDIDNGDQDFLMCDVLTMDKDKRVTRMPMNRGKIKNIHVSLEAYVMKRELFVKLIDKALATSSVYTFSDVLADSLSELKVRGYKHNGFAACINMLTAYYMCNMHLLNEKQLHTLINNDWPIYTMTNDSCPTLYKPKATVSGSIVGNGCIIEGEVRNSVISRSVKIGKGAQVIDSIILPDAVIEENAVVKNCVVDRFATLTSKANFKGEESHPIYVKRGDII